MRRRDVLLVAAAAAVAPRATPAGAAVSGDAATLTRVMRVEHALRAAYALAPPPGAPRVAALATRFGAHEAAHLGALASGLSALGAERPVPLRTPAELDRAAAALGVAAPSAAATSRARLRILLALEEASLASLGLACGRLTQPHLLETAATIMSCQAQHCVVLRETLGREPLPDPFAPPRR